MNTNVNDDFDELEAMFGQEDSDLSKMEKIVLTQNLEGFIKLFSQVGFTSPAGK